MTVQGLNTLLTLCELERTQMLTILAMSVKNPQLAGFFTWKLQQLPLC